MGEHIKQNGNRIADLRCKEVISIASGNRLGYVSDVEIDVCTGRVAALLVPARRNSLFAKRKDHIIPWDSVRRVGEDTILTTFSPEKCDCPASFHLFGEK